MSSSESLQASEAAEPSLIHRTFARDTVNVAVRMSSSRLGVTPPASEICPVADNTKQKAKNRLPYVSKQSGYDILD